MADNEQVAQFVDITGAQPETAAFFLDSTAGDVMAAVDAYYEAGGRIPTAQDAPAAPPPSAVPAPLTAAAPPPQQQRPRAAAAAAPRQARPAPAAGRIRSLADLDGDGDESEEDESNEYYAGGEKSGQVVRGGDGRRRQVESLFEAARQAGAALGSAADLEPERAARGGAFRGRARTLGGGAQESQEVGPAPEAEQDPEQPLVHTITFWANGVFTVDDGEPREVTDPANRPFLEAIGRGECPPELAPAHAAQPVNVNMVRSGQEYAPPARPRQAAFVGRGRTLAGGAGGPQSSAAAAPAGPAAEGGEWEGVDAQKPTTSLQLRLADGSRMVAQFNHSHTVADVRRFIAASRPDMPPGYALLTAFPSAQLADDGQTLAQAGLLNAVVIQKQ